MKAKLIGKCIYCLSPDAPIDEHVIPKSLGGLSTLQKASCKKCADRTSSIINKTTHGVNSFFGCSRIILGMPSRRKKKRPFNFKQTIIDQLTNQQTEIEIPTSDFIDTVFLPTYPLPGIMTGKTIDNGIITDGIQMINANSEKKEVNKKYIHQFKWSSEDLPLLLALIAYCNAVNDFGLDEVIDSPLIPLIKGEKHDLGRWIGTASNTVMKQRNKLVDVMYLTPNRHILMRIKFFAWLKDIPEYLIAVK